MAGQLVVEGPVLVRLARRRFCCGFLRLPGILFIELLDKPLFSRVINILGIRGIEACGRMEGLIRTGFVLRN